MNTESMNKTDKNLIYLVIFLFAAFGLISVIHLAAGSKVLSGPMFQKGDCIISKPSENIEKWEKSEIITYIVKDVGQNRYRLLFAGTENLYELSEGSDFNYIDKHFKLCNSGR